MGRVPKMGLPGSFVGVTWVEAVLIGFFYLGRGGVVLGVFVGALTYWVFP